MYNGREISGFTYTRRFDQHRVDHLVESLLSLTKFGGQGFGRVARSTQFRRSSHAGFVDRVDAGKWPMSIMQQWLSSTVSDSPISPTRSDVHGCFVRGASSVRMTLSLSYCGY